MWPNTQSGKHVTRKSTQALIHTEDDEVKDRFEELILGSETKFVQLESCIPFVCIRNVFKSRISSLKALLNRSVSQEYDTTGIALGFHCPLVVSLKGALYSYVSLHYREGGHSEQTCKDMLECRSERNGIIDGQHRDDALFELVESEVSWSNFSWYVTIVNDDFSIEKYRQLA